jgi:23S rRNA pseudouridine1911/1915/1917 synthase
MVVAKTDQAHAHLVAQLQARTVKRTYHALVWGVPQPRAGKVQTQFGRSTTHRQKMAVKNKGGKEAITHYEVKKSYAALVSLVHCHLATGRTHQIRVHMAYLGHPLLGDKTYAQSTPRGTKNFAQQAPAILKEKISTLPGQMLHAAALSLTHPMSGELMHFDAPEPLSFLETANLLTQVQPSA